MIEIELLRVALGSLQSLSRIPSEKEWRDLYAFAVNHSLVGLFFGGIEKLPHEQAPDRELLLRWLGQAMIQRRQKSFFDSVMAEVAQVLTRENVRFVVFKGLAVASRYPEPSLRTMGDIDFYVPSSDFDRAVEVVEKNICRIDEKDCIDKHFAFEWKGVRFEMHYQMETFGFGGHQRYYGALVDAAVESGRVDHFLAGGVEIPMLPVELDLIQVFKHWMTHLIGEGIGLRQTTDIAVLIDSYRKTVDIASLKGHLTRIGYLRAFDAVVMMVEKYYAIAWPEYWNERNSKCSLTRENAGHFADLLMKDILRNGNFGRSDYKHAKGLAKRLETLKRFCNHCIRYFRLAPKEIFFLIPKRILISLKAH